MYLTISRDSHPERTYQPEWHEPDNVLMQGIRSYYNQIPSNVRALVEFGLFGRTSPLTEKDLSPEQLQAIQSQYDYHAQKNAEDYAKARSAQDALTLDNALQMDPMAAMSGASAQEAYDALKARLGKQTSSYESQMAQGRTPIAKYDQAGHIDEQGWGNVLSGLSDPNMQIGTTLGRYNVLNLPQGQMVYDVYDFDKHKSEQDEPFSVEYLQHPVKGLDWAMRKYGPQQKLPVQIMLPPRSQR
jgi:hypothetical protein